MEQPGLPGNTWAQLGLEHSGEVGSFLENTKHRWEQMGDECQHPYQELSTFIQWSHDMGKMSIGCRSLFKHVFNVNERTHNTSFLTWKPVADIEQLSLI